MDILKLSYDNLPPRLKPCFLYFGIYPVDYEISVKEVIQLWIAEGFIHKENQKTTEELEDVGDRYLDDMVDRSLIQVTKRRSDGGVKTCQIHDLLRDLCISESISDKFLKVCREFNIDTLSLSNSNPRRLSFHCKPDSYIFTNTIHKPCTRSVFIFPKMSIDCSMKSFKLARVLHSEDLRFNSLPSNLKRMIHLRYLKIEYGDLPASISCLWNLETLYVRHAMKASSGIWKMKRLKYLHLGVPELPKASGERLENLHSLWLRTRDRQMILKLKKLMLPRLKKLTLLTYDILSRAHFLEELPSLHPLSSLQSLNIEFDIARFSNSNEFPLNLTKIILRLSPGVECGYLMNTLGGLANLKNLKLDGRGGRGTIQCDLDVGTGKFLQLQVFHVRALVIRSWRLEEGAMLNLKSLVINDCFLDELPKQIWSLNTLELVHLLRPRQEMINELQNVEIKYGCKLIIES